MRIGRLIPGIIPFAAGVALLASCAGRGAKARLADLPPPAAKVELRDAVGTDEGHLWFSRLPDGRLRIHGEVRGLQPEREYSLHIHAQGMCANPEAPSTRAEPDLAILPGSPASGVDEPASLDLPEVRTDPAGVAEVDFLTEIPRTKGGEALIGRTLMLHAESDAVPSRSDQEEGAATACGVIEPAPGSPPSG